MSKTQWPKIIARKYHWQDKSGAIREGVNFQISCTLLNGTRYQRSFKDRKDAEDDAVRLRSERDVELKNRTVSLNHLVDQERIDVLESRRILDGKAALKQCVAFYLEHNILPSGPALTVNEAIKRYMLQSEEDGLRDRSMQDLRGRLQKFADTFGKRP